MEFLTTPILENTSIALCSETSRPDKKNVRGAGTAMKRQKVSAPVRWLQQKELLKGRILDYGSGRSFDADALSSDRYDPYWHPVKPTGKYDTIICNYVLNVVGEEVQGVIIKDIRNLLKKDGIAYVSVRRDIKGKKRVDRKVQRWVELDFPTVNKTTDYEMYKVVK